MDPLKNKQMLKMAMEWATELAKYQSLEDAKIAAPIIQWGFAEVERGRNTDTVLKEDGILTRC